MAIKIKPCKCVIHDPDKLPSINNIDGVSRLSKLLVAIGLTPNIVRVKKDARIRGEKVKAGAKIFMAIPASSFEEIQKKLLAISQRVFKQPVLIQKSTLSDKIFYDLGMGRSAKKIESTLAAKKLSPTKVQEKAGVFKKLLAALFPSHKPPSH